MDIELNLRQLIIKRLIADNLMQAIVPYGIKNDAREYLFNVSDLVDDVWQNHHKFLSPDVINPVWRAEMDKIAANIKTICIKLDDEDLINLFERTVAYAAR